MQCNDVLLLISEFNRGELQASTSQQVQAHLQSCPSCSQEASLDKKLSQMLLQNAPELPQTMAFSMMQDRVWAQLESKRKKRTAWLGLFGFATSAALVALFFFWPGAPSKSTESLLPVLTQDELAVVDEMIRENPMRSLIQPIDISELDEESADTLSQKIAKILPQTDLEEQNEIDDGSYLDELDSLSPEELERLESLLDAKKKG
jgi:anti-sigma factor RsiW